MKASIELRRADLIRVCLLLFPRHSGNRNFLLVTTLLAALWSLWGNLLLTPLSLLLALLTGLLAGLGGLLAGLLVQLLSVYWNASRQPGVLGHHEFELTEAGLIERTEFNESLLRWSSLGWVLLLPDHLVLRCPNGVHVLPRRGFHGELDFDSFCRELLRQRAAAGLLPGLPCSQWLLHVFWLIGCLLLVLWLTLFAPVAGTALPGLPGGAERPPRPDPEQFDPQALQRGLQIQQLPLQRDGEQLWVPGRLENHGRWGVSEVELEVELFDSAGQFLSECRYRLPGVLAAGSSENVRIDCGHAPAFASLTLRVMAVQPDFERD